MVDGAITIGYQLRRSHHSRHYTGHEEDSGHPMIGSNTKGCGIQQTQYRLELESLSHMLLSACRGLKNEC